MQRLDRRARLARPMLLLVPRWRLPRRGETVAWSGKRNSLSTGNEPRSFRVSKRLKIVLSASAFSASAAGHEPATADVLGGVRRADGASGHATRLGGAAADVGRGEFGGLDSTWLRASSAIAVMVRLGLTPTLAGRVEPSVMSMFS
jgi:hypothetical protein